MPKRLLDQDRLRRLLEIGGTLVSNLDLESLLRQIADAARELTGARYAALGVLDAKRERLERFITSGIDESLHAKIGELPQGRGVLGELINDPHVVRLHDLKADPRSYGFPTDHPEMERFLGVPIMIRDEAYGNLYLADKESGDFDERDEASVLTLAKWAAIAIDNAHSVHQERLRAAIAVAERERGRWARELHDDTLQNLGALRVLLASAENRGDINSLRRAARAAVEQIAVDITNLRSLITELRPAALDEIGLRPALESLATRVEMLGDVEIRSEIELGSVDDGRFAREVEGTAYRLVQEALNNVTKHAEASRVWLTATLDGDALEVTVRDDGHGFDTARRSDGFGLTGMRERVQLVGGTLDIESSADNGTTVHATLPARRADAAPGEGAYGGTATDQDAGESAVTNPASSA